jgi:hypothetical protein
MVDVGTGTVRQIAEFAGSYPPSLCLLTGVGYLDLGAFSAQRSAMFVVHPAGAPVLVLRLGSDRLLAWTVDGSGLLMSPTAAGKSIS